MTAISIVLAILIVAAVIYLMFRSGNKEAHHLDDLHISPPSGPKKEE
jgi:hypothetical protein